MYVYVWVYHIKTDLVSHLVALRRSVNTFKTTNLFSLLFVHCFENVTFILRLFISIFLKSSIDFFLTPIPPQSLIFSTINHICFYFSTFYFCILFILLLFLSNSSCFSSIDLCQLLPRKFLSLSPLPSSLTFFFCLSRFCFAILISLQL